MLSSTSIRRSATLLLVLFVALALCALSLTSSAQQPEQTPAPTPQSTPTPTPDPTQTPTVSPSPEILPAAPQSTPTEQTPAQPPAPTPTPQPQPQLPTEPSPALPAAPTSPETRPRTVTSEAQQTQPAENATGAPKPVLWHETNISSLDLYAGPGGDVVKPDLSRVTYVEDEQGGYSTKYRVRDGAGNIWVAKVGKEAQPETVSSRLVWAMGYYTDLTYLVPTLKIEGKGTFQNVRLEARPKGYKRLDNWKWENNPFVGTRELQGLKVLMLLLDNWDLKEANNRIVRVHNPETNQDELRYIISDLGATLGKTGGAISRSRNKPSDFEKAKFITGVRNNVVQFDYHGKDGSLVRDITVDQARWIGGLLAQLTDQQLNDAVRAANYDPEDAQLIVSTLRARIDALKNLPGGRQQVGSTSR